MNRVGRNLDSFSLQIELEVLLVCIGHIRGRVDAIDRLVVADLQVFDKRDIGRPNCAKPFLAASEVEGLSVFFVLLRF